MKTIVDRLFSLLLSGYVFYEIAQSSILADSLCETTATSAIYYLAEHSECKTVPPMTVDWQRKLLNYVSPETFAVCDEFGKTLSAFAILGNKELANPNENTQTLFLWTYCIGEYHQHLFRNSSRGLVVSLRSCYFQALDLQPHFEPCFSARPLKEWTNCMIPSNQTSSE